MTVVGGLVFWGGFTDFVGRIAVTQVNQSPLSRLGNLFGTVAYAYGPYTLRFYSPLTKTCGFGDIPGNAGRNPESRGTSLRTQYLLSNRQSIAC